jgi:signal transduction histidine kinase
MLPESNLFPSHRSSSRRMAALEERIELLQDLYELTSTVNSAHTLDEIFQKALLVLQRIHGASRASILLFDDAGVMRFRAWTGLSDDYRRAVEGHSPWTRSMRNPAPVIVHDVEREPSLAGLCETILREGIRSLCFFPLTHQGQLLGKFMVYYDQPHVPGAAEVHLSQIIAHHISSGVGRTLAREERERLLELEQASRRSLEEANRVKDDFLAVLSHELRTPIAAIVGWVQVLREGRGLDEATRARALETIERNTHLQSRLIEDLLDVSRIVSGTLSLDPRPIDLRTLVAATCETIRPTSDAKGLTLVVDLGAAPAIVDGDAARLQQVFWNLLTNAVKSTPSGGTISVGVGRSGSDIVVSVTDTGRGIGADFMPHVFERFRQAESGTRRLQTGLGLGLSIVHDLVELHHGRVDVHSQGKGKGATFSVTLPIDRSALDPVERTLPSPAVSSASSFPDLQGTKVLLVEDETDVREVLAILLQKCGARVTRAASAREALESYRMEQPDVLVTDIGMPIEDGYDLLSQIRSLKPGPGKHAPAIALTGYARGEDRHRAIEAGFQMHIPKPVDPMDLARAVLSLRD